MLRFLEISPVRLSEKSRLPLEAAMSVEDPQGFGQLLAAAREGDRSQIARLLDLYREHLWKTAADRLANDVAAKTAPSDVVQETMIRGVRAFASFQGSTECELRAWLWGILTHIVVDTHRRYRDVAKRDISRESPLHDGLVLGGETPSALLESAETMQRLDQARLSLDEKHCQIIQLVSIDQLDFKVAGERLQLTSEAARKLWKRAIRKLARKLKQDDSGFVGPV